MEEFHSHFKNDETNVNSVNVANAIISKYGRWVWEEIMEIAQCGTLYTNRGSVFEDVKRLLDECGVAYTTKTGGIGLRFYLELVDRNQAIIYNPAG